MLKPGSVLVPNPEHRVVLGTVVFVGIVLLIGWIVINEPARMQVFTQTYHARSVENGATIFANTCATCHGIDAKGIANKAPALDNPMLFLSDNPATAAKKKVDDLTAQQSQLKSTLSDLKSLPDDQKAYDAMTPDQQASKDGKTLKNKIDAETKSTAGSTETDLNKQISDLDPQIAAAQKALDDLVAKGWDPTRDVRLTETKWGGSLHDYIYSTVTSGRPVSVTYWPQAMPTWGQSAGGPLRPDEVEDVTQYILNFQDQAVNLTPKDVNEQFKNPALLAGGPAKTGTISSIPNFDLKKFAADLVAGKAVDASNKPITGDSGRGQTLYASPLGCNGCHGTGNPPTCPPTSGTYTRIVNTRMSAGGWATPEEYIAESVLKPNAYVVPNYPAGVMPQDFATKLTPQDLADIIAYLQTQK